MSEATKSHLTNQENNGRKLLVIDTSFSFEAISSRGLEESVICRDLNGFFDHVWTVHPFATMVTSESWSDTYGRAEWHKVGSRHTFIEGKVGRFSILKCAGVLNFLFSQVDLLFSLLKLIRKERIGVIRVGEPHYNAILGWILSRLAGIPLLIRVGSDHELNYKVSGRIHLPRLFKTRRIEKIIERFTLARADVVAGANQKIIDFALANGARKEVSTLFRYGNLIAKHHFIGPEKRQEGLSLLVQIGVEPGRFLLNIARLESVKQVDDVVRVLAEIRRRDYNLKAVLVGDGRLRESLFSLANELGVKDFIVFCGNKNQDWLSRVIPLAAVVVSPYMGRALTEAALGAVPIVAYDLDWQKELIESGVTGELIPHRDWKGMADAVEKYLNDPAYSRSMGEAVRMRALNMMAPDKLNQHERDTYNKLLNNFKKNGNQ
jgi:glycosyltransferase involved in cell wall biosynthesis